MKSPGGGVYIQRIDRNSTLSSNLHDFFPCPFPTPLGRKEVCASPPRSTQLFFNAYPIARPCPFYSQGRCLFSDSCNFLHEAKIKVKIQQPEGSPPQTRNTPPDSPLTPFVRYPLRPRNSPETPSPVPAFVPRARSPRLSSLLMALGDAIHKGEDDLISLTAASAGPSLLPSPLPTRDLEVLNDDDEHVSASSSYVLRSLDLEDSPKEDGETIHESDFCGPLPASPEPVKEQGELSEILSSIEITLPPALLLSPDQLSSLPHNREDSIDSGYADGWTGPSPFALSPPRTPRRHSAFDLLSPPFHSPFCHVLSPPFVPSVATAWPASFISPSRKSSHTRSASQPAHTLSDDLDSPTQYHLQLRPEPEDDVSSEPDPEATVRPSASPNLHDEDVVDEEQFSISTLGDSTNPPAFSVPLPEETRSRDSPTLSQSSPRTSPRHRRKPSSLTLDTGLLLTRSPLTAVDLPPTLDDEADEDAPTVTLGVARNAPPECQAPPPLVAANTHMVDLSAQSSDPVDFGLDSSRSRRTPSLPGIGNIVSLPDPEARPPVFSPPQGPQFASPEQTVSFVPARGSLRIDTSPVLHRGHVAKASSASEAVFPSVAESPARPFDFPIRSAPAWSRSQSPASDFTPHTKRWEAHASSSTKVPFGFRHSVGVSVSLQVLAGIRS